MTDDRRTPSDLSDLDARLRAARDDAGSMGRSGRSRLVGASGSGLGVAMRVGVELVSTVLVGVGIGWALDRWLGTAPWLMVVFVFLGGAAGVMNVYRVVQGLDDSVGLGQAVERKQRESGVKDDSNGDDMRT